MKKVAIGFVIVAILAVAGIVIAMNRSSNKSNSSNTNSTQTTSNQQSQSSTPVAINSVTVSNFTFSPADITVKKGTTVTWANQDSVVHKVQETDGQTGPDGSALDPGKSYSFTYNTTGTYKYHCAIHTEMTGSVTVTD